MHTKGLVFLNKRIKRNCGSTTSDARSTKRGLSIVGYCAISKRRPVNVPAVLRTRRNGHQYHTIEFHSVKKPFSFEAVALYSGTNSNKTKEPRRAVCLEENTHCSGGHLLSRDCTTIGPRGLTAVFGKGTGVAL